jgi:galactokinase
MALEQQRGAAMKQTDRQAEMTARFIERYNQTPLIWSRAPGRVDLMGSHTDYNLGYVMTMTIDRDTWIAAAPREDEKVCVSSLNLNGVGTFSLNGIEHAPKGDWTEYVRGVAWSLQQEGYRLNGWNGLIHSTIPISSGLSSSAAIEMASAVILQKVSGFDLDPLQMALIGQKAENHFVGVNSGILDQYSSAMGQEGCSLLLDCRSLTSQSVPIAHDIQVVICDTKAPRNLVGSEYDERRAQCEEGVRILKQHYPDIQALRDVSLEMFMRCQHHLPEVVAKRCLFIIEENQRVLELAPALSSGDRPRLAVLYAASYAGARDLYQIGAPSMQAMYDAMLNAPGVIAARQAGAGFGGAMIALVVGSQVDTFAGKVSEHYQRQTGILPCVYPVSASHGVGLI